MSLSFSRAVVCLSGGMDSTSLLLHLLARGVRISAVSFDYGQKHKLELERLATNIEYLQSRGIEIAYHPLDVSGVGNIFHSALLDKDWSVPEGHYETKQMKQTVVPNRNAIFASIAFGHALSLATKHHETVCLSLGVHSGDHAIYPDCRPEFYQAIHHAFQIGNWDADRVPLYLPYLSYDKYRILQDAQKCAEQLELDFERVFANTLTSYAPTADGRSHGLTGSDVERILAFHQLGIRDPIDYRHPWEEVVATALKCQEDEKKNSPR